MKISAMSKINLGMDVLKRRPDGYHEVRMVMQSLSLCDELDIKNRDDDRVIITCNAISLECDENNLIYKAVKRITEEAGVTAGFDIELTKNIPIAAGNVLPAIHFVIVPNTNSPATLNAMPAEAPSTANSVS